MSDVMTPTSTPSIADSPPSSPVPMYGWRYIRRELPGGRCILDEVPLTLEDCLHPQEDDQIPEDNVHFDERSYLYQVFLAQFTSIPGLLVLSDTLVDFTRRAANVARRQRLRRSSRADAPLLDVPHAGTVGASTLGAQGVPVSSGWSAVLRSC
jgi:hypothetical protein